MDKLDVVGQSTLGEACVGIAFFDCVGAIGTLLPAKEPRASETDGLGKILDHASAQVVA